MLEGLQKFFNTYSWYDASFLKKELSHWHDTILDVGCGTTRLKFFLPTDASYTGIDFNSSVADYKVNISKERFPFPDHSFDFAICNAVLYVAHV